jgi:hypothetical protein
MNTLEKITCLDSQDTSPYAISFAASEYAREGSSPAERSRRFEVSHEVRQMEEAHYQDGKPMTPVLLGLRLIAETEDEHEDEFKALYALRNEFERMLSPE